MGEGLEPAPATLTSEQVRINDTVQDALSTVLGQPPQYPKDTVTIGDKEYTVELRGQRAVIHPQPTGVSAADVLRAVKEQQAAPGATQIFDPVHLQEFIDLAPDPANVLVITANQYHQERNEARKILLDCVGQLEGTPDEKRMLAASINRHFDDIDVQEASSELVPQRPTPRPQVPISIPQEVRDSFTKVVCSRRRSERPPVEEAPPLARPARAHTPPRMEPGIDLSPAQALEQAEEMTDDVEDEPPPLPGVADPHLKANAEVVSPMLPAPAPQEIEEETVAPGPQEAEQVHTATPPPPQTSVLASPEFRVTPELKAAFSADSSRLLTDPSGPKADVLGSDQYHGSPPPPVVIGKSHFVPGSVLQFMMKNKTDYAGYGVKFNPQGVPDQKGEKFGPCFITPMEGVLHTYATPVVGGVRMCGDCYYDSDKVDGEGRPVPHQRTEFGDNKFRPVILSTAIHPDCETAGTEPPSQSVFLRLAEITDEPVAGQELPPDFQPLSMEDRLDPEKVAAYDQKLLEHQLHHLTSGHGRIAKSQIEHTYTMESAEGVIAGLVATGASPEEIRAQLRTSAIKLTGGSPPTERLISMEILYNSYVEQLQNEFSVLEALSGENGYVYTIDPPSIFAKQLGAKGAHALNLFQCLAFQSIRPSLKHLKKIGVGGPPDEQASLSSLYNAGEKAAREKLAGEGKAEAHGELAMPKFSMQDDTHRFRDDVLGGATLVLHNNGDAFYQNLKWEPAGGSLDGEIGASCNASLALDPGTNPQLLKHVIDVGKR
jgi:hypothetical protein